MAIIASTSDLSRPFQHAAVLLAQSATFQAITGADEATTLANFIDYPFRDVEEFGTKNPGAVLSDDDDLYHRRDKRTQGGAGQLYAQFLFPLNAAYVNDPKNADDDRNQILDFRNKLGAILLEMLTAAGTPNGAGTAFYWNMTGYQKVATPTIADPDEFGVEFLYAAFILEWNG